jgi:glucose-6-phosphate 1-dehydrogenase
MVEPCIVIIFGATGDLTQKRLFPALYNLSVNGQLPLNFACVAFARKEKTNESFRKEIKETLVLQNNNMWAQFEQQLFYLTSNFDDDTGYERLLELLSSIDKKMGTKKNRLFYLATPPKYFSLIVENLSKHKLIYPPEQANLKWSRVIIEKPFGQDITSAQQLQKKLLKHLHEKQIYLIDHYLGKETVQNLFAFRFANPLFESVWNANHIDHVQITVAEDNGVGSRAPFFEETGILKDVIQNHMMQLLSLVAMEPPKSFQSEDILKAKITLLQHIKKPIKKEDIIRGQYGHGFIEGRPVASYREEPNVSPSSITETYAAIKLFINNERWKNVPFYLRAGKRLAKKATEIAIMFKNTPSCCFLQNYGNTLVISIQPQESISLKINCKNPFDNIITQPVKMEFSYKDHFGFMAIEAYARLIKEAISGDKTLFISSKEALLSWQILDPIIKLWQQEQPKDFPNYAAGSWGPENSLLGNKKWRLL